MTKRKRCGAEKETPPAAELPSAATVDTPLATEPDSVAGPERRFPIVGIGASAGGLTAFGAFFSAIPGEISTGIAFVLVQHLVPGHKSILSDLVKRYTRMKVYEVEDGMKVTPNCAYIIPPNRDMAILNGALQLLEPAAPHGQRLPIDYFFRSLAQDQRERAICIVLSGTGSDGTLEVRAIKGEGGMVMVQTPEPPSMTACPAALSPPALWTMCCLRPRCRRSSWPTPQRNNRATSRLSAGRRNDGCSGEGSLNGKFVFKAG